MPGTVFDYQRFAFCKSEHTLLPKCVQKTSPLLIIIYQSESGETKIDVRFQDETVWLTQAQMEELFQSSHANVVEHIKNIYSEGELDESSTCRKFRQVRREGNRNVERERLYYNLDMIISLGYCPLPSLIPCVILQ